MSDKATLYSFLLGVIFAALMALTAGTVSAAPATSQVPHLTNGNSLITHIRGCHRNVRGNRRPHFHKGRNCRRVNVRRIRDCHRSVQRHQGRRFAHRHVGRNCAVRNYRERRRGYGRNCVFFGPIRFCEG